VAATPTSWWWAEASAGWPTPWRNAVLRARDVHDYTHVDWLFGPTALTPEELPPMFPAYDDGVAAAR
jgi:salicylate hydroxylase